MDTLYEPVDLHLLSVFAFLLFLLEGFFNGLGTLVRLLLVDGVVDQLLVAVDFRNPA